MEIRGNLVFTFKLRNPTSENIQKAMSLCEEMEGYQAKTSVPQILRNEQHKRRRVSKEESYSEIIGAIKSQFFQKGFTLKEVIPVVFEKIGKRKDSTQNAVSWAMKQGIFVRRSRTYAFAEYLQQKVADNLRTKDKEHGELEQPITATAPV